ncbi:cbb3-type cytochrome oxidase assembly protein CcoS [Pseudomonas songnenensis]|jgi:cbb3-type cytochrome oxidase maturation protein|uniref:Cbb3-type cytochrome oxidase assembly protein CcoS n=1 Tax=Pseudomonas songnenensis TaxID=1176259 RepID=A0A482U4G6_9PSED|nr:cbb3-type cytochrome oxidase assembly protein CcoS [Pseudomonas songnenensis]AWM58246.1 cbb3-type cytochrome oxidase assembly protein CcoS [Stutzerimonas stutzeri]MCQ4299497.1 cbb3-type cytochrome oxidase assembly protein CcoS [Pseudomonas songnenensis]RMH94374.1 cbb3-type cytochrome oxidase assembly protein CcoS [Pseudomonas songnenensis]RYJ59408.1 cbb3-type cytochrome oxidase assembly protein CcoS [Pseudomonas songnenensis]
MAALYILIPVAVVLVAVAIWVFFWAVDSGQFDDLDGPAHSILFDDEEPQKPSASEPQKDPEPEQGKRNGE